VVAPRVAASQVPPEPVPSVSGIEMLKRTAECWSWPEPFFALKRTPVYLLAL
jgi:hypothetical protein